MNAPIRIPVSLRSVAFDTGTVEPGATSLSFFQDGPRTGGDVLSDVSEPVIVQWIIKDVRTRPVLLEVLSLPVTARTYAGVCSPFTTPNKKPGDIDFLACDLDRPDRAVAIEYKKVKVRNSGDAENINRLDALGGADLQARELFKLGFLRTYLGVLVVVDGRANEENNFLFRGVSNVGYRRIIEFAGGVTLAEDVGIIYTEIVQPVRRSAMDAAVFSVAVAKEAKPRHQAERVTTLMANFASTQSG